MEPDSIAKFEAPLIEMEFWDKNGGLKVITRLFPPTYDPSSESWYCLGEVSGLRDGRLKRSYGNNPFQAVIQAMTRFRCLLDEDGRAFENHQGEPFEIIFPRYIPWTYGSDVYNNLSDLIDAEISKIEAEITKKRERWEATRKGGDDLA